MGSTSIREHLILDADTSTWAGTVGRRQLPATPFTVVVDVLLTLQSVTAGWSWALSSKSPPTVQIWDGDDSPADATIDVIVRGIA